ncbi:MAG: hypothetical protein ACRDHZ_11685, partial [Ktedonobacteraceae bacterium]
IGYPHGTCQPLWHLGRPRSQSLFPMPYSPHSPKLFRAGLNTYHRENTFFSSRKYGRMPRDQVLYDVKGTDEIVSDTPQMNPRLAKRIGEKKKQLDASRPLDQGMIRRLHEDFRVEATYHSNAIEGKRKCISKTSLRSSEEKCVLNCLY